MLGPSYLVLTVVLPERTHVQPKLRRNALFRPQRGRGVAVDGVQQQTGRVRIVQCIYQVPFGAVNRAQSEDTSTLR